MNVRAAVGAVLFGLSLAASSAAQTAPEFTRQADDAYTVPGEVLVDLRDDLPRADVADVFATLAVSFRMTALADDTKVAIARAAPGRVDELLAKLGKDSRVEIVEPHRRVRASFVPDDPLLKEQWHLSRVGAERAWDFSTGRGATVAVVDTGIACEDFEGFTKASDLASTRCVAGFNFVARSTHASDDQGHGTHVAGTIAQSTNNAIGAAGVAFDARLMPVKVLSADGWGTVADVADGIRWAADHGADVINLSLGSPFPSRILDKAIAHAKKKGVVVVAAAGNSMGPVEYPGASPGVIGVSATDADDALAWFSSRGPGVDLAAPGVGVTQQTICNGGQNRCERFPQFSGTSMASPHVAGAAALLVSLGVTEPAAVERALSRAARAPAGGQDKARFGAGHLDAGAAVQSVALRQVLARLFALSLLILLVFRWTKKQGSTLGPWRPSFLIPAFATGPGLLFFAPFVAPRHLDAIDLAARPLGDWDLLISPVLHGFVPLATALIPLGATLLLLGVPGARRPLAGLCLGSAAYLIATAVLGDVYSPLGRAFLIAWCAVNALGCVHLSRLVLVERR